MNTVTTAAHGGATDHWLQQRLTAGSNLFLMLWLVLSLAMLPAYDYGTIALWLGSPWAAIPLLLLVISTFHHFRLGLQVVIEDYQTETSRVLLLALANIFTVVVAALAVFSILKVAIAAGAA